MENIMFDDYNRMREILGKEIPEIFETEKYRETIDFWNDEEIPMYCYYEILECLFIDLLKGNVLNNELLERVLDFMENMAKSKDADIQNLLQVQILEGLFGLNYKIFNNMERKLLRPATLSLFQQTKTGFNSPNV
jgi:hypothetical protein